MFTKTPMATYPKIDPRDYDDKRDVGLKCYGGIFISGYGTVLDTWTNRKGGTVLHAIVKHGQVVMYVYMNVFLSSSVSHSCLFTCVVCISLRSGLVITSPQAVGVERSEPSSTTTTRASR